ncbi:carbohydrate-binding protein [Streptomyces beihaiensis]|uniref:Carbohydrate-binding protein n=1 Tax=Streptomyces beihaiensis TaxID=2984495 RepID=A0ABT3U056_9ACTN|nr:carbohydrate-binding protein [Streptomyces beihaiensis]MCX3061603.1 carbohydrate-binding protein [Streptomyces beihaiensis]
MAPGNNGASTTPEDDDPFGYLYADGQAAGATPPSGGGGYGYPQTRSSHNPVRANQVRTVGERQYGQQVPGQQQAHPQQAYPQAGYPQPGYPQQAGPQQAGGPDAYYSAPETLPGGAPQGPPGSYGPQQGGPVPPQRGGGRGPNTKALLIGAVAVVAAVVIGIGVAMLGNGDDKGADASDKPSGATQSAPPSQTSSQTAQAPVDLPKTDAKSLKLDGGATTASDVQGAQAAGGVYVGGFNQVGAAVTWTINDIPKSGKYTLFVGYGVPGEDQSVTLTVNDIASSTPVKLKNWAGAQQGDWEKGWTQTFNFIQLNKGTNTIKISCEQGDQCNANLDQLWLKDGWVRK